MKAAVVNSFDVPPRFQTFDDPVAGTDEEVVEVIAAGLHPITKALANGTHYGSTGKLPFIPGVDGVARDSNGATIYFGSLRAPFGSFCERTLSSRQLSIPLPAGLDPVIAAGIANPGHVFLGSPH